MNVLKCARAQRLNQLLQQHCMFCPWSCTKAFNLFPFSHCDFVNNKTIEKHLLNQNVHLVVRIKLNIAVSLAVVVKYHSV